MSDMTVQGVVHLIEATKTYGQKGFRKRLVVLEQAKERFTNYIPVDFLHEGCDKVDDLSVGDEVDVPFRLSGRKWQRDEQSEVKFFLSAEATEFRILQKAGGDADNDRPPERTDWDAPADSDDEVPF
jgi:hypothetical protein